MELCWCLRRTLICCRRCDLLEKWKEKRKEYQQANPQNSRLSKRLLLKRASTGKATGLAQMMSEEYSKNNDNENVENVV